MAVDIVNLLQGPGEIPPVLLVSIGYPAGEDMRHFVQLRTRDFMPTRDAIREALLAEMAGGADVRGGGADAFLQFLTDELQPG